MPDSSHAVVQVAIAVAVGYSPCGALAMFVTCPDRLQCVRQQLLLAAPGTIACTLAVPDACGVCIDLGRPN